jgi:hypothetical protein
VVPGRYGREMRERAYQLWAGVGARNASATRRLLKSDVGADEPVPTDRCIRNWVREEAWTARADRHMGETRGLSLAEWQVRRLAVLLGQMDDVAQLLNGAGDSTTAANASYLRQSRRQRKRMA